MLQAEHLFGSRFVLELNEGESERLLGLLVPAKLEVDDRAIDFEVLFEGGW